jgi:hypothetical protein
MGERTNEREQSESGGLTRDECEDFEDERNNLGVSKFVKRWK